MVWGHSRRTEPLVCPKAPESTVRRRESLARATRQQSPGDELSAVKDFVVQRVRCTASRNLLGQDNDVGGAG